MAVYSPFTREISHYICLFCKDHGRSSASRAISGFETFQPTSRLDNFVDHCFGKFGQHKDKFEEHGKRSTSDKYAFFPSLQLSGSQRTIRGYYKKDQVIIDGKIVELMMINMGLDSACRDRIFTLPDSRPASEAAASSASPQVEFAVDMSKKKSFEMVKNLLAAKMSFK